MTADHRHRRLLRPHHKRPNRRAAGPRDELQPSQRTVQAARQAGGRAIHSERAIPWLIALMLLCGDPPAIALPAAMAARPIGSLGRPPSAPLAATDLPAHPSDRGSQGDRWSAATTFWLAMVTFPCDHKKVAAVRPALACHRLGWPRSFSAPACGARALEFDGAVLFRLNKSKSLDCFSRIITAAITVNT